MEQGYWLRERLRVSFFSPFIVIAFLIVFTLLSACSSIDCPLNNRIYTTYKLAGSLTTLQDTFSVYTTRNNGKDSLLINLDVNIDSFSLPIRYRGTEDIFYFQIGSPSKSFTFDTVRVQKLDHPHFESVDCNPSFFHTITGVSHTPYRIDSIVINNAHVTYDVSKSHFLIYFKDNRY